jgi:hypothetical protein
MASKKSILLGIVGKTLKKGPPKIKAKAPPKIKSKGPYVRTGKVVPTTKEFKARRDVFRGVQKKPKGIGITDIVGAGAAGYAVGKGWHKKLVGAVTKAVKKDKPSHQDIARKGAKELIKKQKEKKEKRKSHH